MKTIEEASKDYAISEMKAKADRFLIETPEQRKGFSPAYLGKAFKAGASFASTWIKVKDEKPEGDVIFKTPWGDIFRGRIGDDGEDAEGIWIFDGFEVEGIGSSYTLHPEFNEDIPAFEYLPLMRE